MIPTMPSPLDDPNARARALGGLSAGRPATEIATELGVPAAQVRRLQATLIVAHWMYGNDRAGRGQLATRAPRPNPRAVREKLRRNMSIFSSFVLQLEVDQLRAKHNMVRLSDLDAERLAACKVEHPKFNSRQRVLV